MSGGIESPTNGFRADQSGNKLVEAAAGPASDLSLISATRESLDHLDPAALSSIIAFLRRTSGIELALDHGYLVISRLEPVVRQFGIEGLSELADALKGTKSSELRMAVVDAMTTNETSFFRNNDVFETTVNKIVPSLVDRSPSDQTLNFWCAACSSGQEVYSLAIALSEAFPELVRRRRFRILASDLSPKMVQRTRDAVYSQFEVSRGLSPEYLDRYFTPQRRDWVARESLRRMVETRQLNLVAPWRSVPKCELVLMRNVLIYFGVEAKTQILTRMRDEILAPSGALVLGATESIPNHLGGYSPVRHSRTVFYQVA